MKALSALGFPRTITLAMRPNHGPLNPKFASAPAAHEAAYLAHVVWERSGRPPELRRQYRREVEIQLCATRHLLEAELQHAPFRGDETEAPAGAV